MAAAVLGTMLMGGVVATQTAAAADPVPTTVTLPLFGAPLTIGITTGPGGALTDVTVDPATGVTDPSASAHKVVFKSANLTDPLGDPARVVIKSKHGGQSVSARAGSLADVSGPGGWSGDVFGDGTTSTVAFTIAAAADGSPDITGVTATGAANEVGTVQHSSGEGDDDEGNSMSARVSIKFTNAAGDQSRTLSIKVRVGTNEDGETSAKLSISLSGIRGVAGKAVGPHTWTGLLCDNTAASIAYDVAADGTITVGTITPAGATVSSNDGKTSVTFATGEQVRIKVSDHDGQMTVSVKEKIRCDSADATVNGSSVPSNNNGDHHNGGGDNHGHGDHAGGDDDATTSSTSTTSTTTAP